jgi:hypothetical protein
MAVEFAHLRRDVDSSGAGGCGLRGFGMGVTAVELSLPEGVDEHSIATCRYVERQWGVRVAGVSFGVCVNADGSLLAALLEGEELEAEAIHEFAGSEREDKGDSAAIDAGAGSGEGRIGDGREGMEGCARRLDKAGTHRGVCLRSADGGAPDARVDWLPMKWCGRG